MSNRPFRPFDHERDMKAVERIWIECGWIDDEADERKACANFFKLGETEVATIDDVAECAVHWTHGTMQYQDETLPLGVVTAVTTSHVSRKLGFAKELTARSLARQADAGMATSALGIFDQGFYNQLGYGNGPYELLAQFDPATLTVDAPFRPPTRLTKDHYKEIHRALCNRKMYHGAATLEPPEIMQVELLMTEKPYGLGYFDGKGGALSHFIWGEMKGEHGPYKISARAYQTNEQLMELLALIKSLGDQISSFSMLEFGEFQLQDMIRQPFRGRQNTAGGKHAQKITAWAQWQMRILDLQACIAKTRLPGPGIRFNLQLTDPVGDLLGGDMPWRGLAGDYVIDLGEESKAKPGSETRLPTLKASVNAFSRMWFGVRPASNIAITDDLHGDANLIAMLDRAIRLPKPHFGWDF